MLLIPLSKSLMFKQFSCLQQKAKFIKRSNFSDIFADFFYFYCANEHKCIFLVYWFNERLEQYKLLFLFLCQRAGRSGIFSHTQQGWFRSVSAFCTDGGIKSIGVASRVVNPFVMLKIHAFSFSGHESDGSATRRTAWITDRFKYTAKTLRTEHEQWSRAPFKLFSKVWNFLPINFKTAKMFAKMI